jgi:mRNA interferase HigB
MVASLMRRVKRRKATIGSPSGFRGASDVMSPPVRKAADCVDNCAVDQAGPHASGNDGRLAALSYWLFAFCEVRLTFRPMKSEAPGLRVISKRRLQEFWRRPGHGDAEQPLTDWFNTVNSREIDWRHVADVRATYRRADQVGDCVVFDIRGNKYRLITIIRYDIHMVYVRKVMTHKEYDANKWQEECGCFTSVPRHRAAKAKAKEPPARKGG